MLQSDGPVAGGGFISYRREEATAYAHLLHSLLNDRLSGVPVFMDLHAIEPGEDFAAAIKQAVTNSLVLLILIGPDWRSSAAPTAGPGSRTPMIWFGSRSRPRCRILTGC